MTQEIRFIDPDKVLEANWDYIDRMERDGVRAVYDSKLDSLFIEIGGPKEALNEHLVDNIMLRIEPESLEVVGMEILDFFSDFLPNNRLVQAMVEEQGFRGGSDFEVELMEPRYKPIREVLQALVPHGA